VQSIEFFDRYFGQLNPPSTPNLFVTLRFTKRIFVQVGLREIQHQLGMGFSPFTNKALAKT
jgi:hypothetical protein